MMPMHNGVRAMPRVLILLFVCAVPFAAQSAQYRNDAGRFSVWLPDAWIVAQQGNRLDAHNPPDTVQVVVAPLKDGDADLTDEDVADFVDDEIDEMRVTADRQMPVGNLPARHLEGTGKDEGDNVTFHAVAIDPGGTAPVIEALVYGEDKAMTHDQVQNAVAHILRSLRPF
jgi:hypothetical protein